MADLDRLISSLHPLERKVLPFIGRHHDVKSIIAVSKLSDTEVIRAVQWLHGKGLIDAKDSFREMVDLDENGKKYLSSGLPEKRFIVSAKKNSGFSSIKRDAGLGDDEMNICIGLLKRIGAIDVRKEGNAILISLTSKGLSFASSGFPSESFLKIKFPVDVSSLSEKDKAVLQDLKSRKSIIRVFPVKETQVSLLPLGLDVLKKGLDIQVIDRLTPGVIKSGEWKGKEFRRYDIQSNVPRIFGGRKQHYRRFLEEVREKLLSMGFTEMNGPIVETEFWDMDALFMPQFHSARDIHDAYYVKNPKYSSDLPEDLVSKVKSAHETGIAGSRGWKYSFDVKRTHRHVLRTQDTSISPRVLSSPDLKVPGKYFQMVRCFRYDVIDATHLADFNQIGGFVVEEGINLRHLVGLLRLFAKEFAETDEVKVVPAYFPFTEPSAAVYAKHPQMGWIELGGSGIFRPEMTYPLGVKAPVIAWGIGVERLAMFKLGLKDIRQLFSHDLEFLRSIKVI